MVPPTDPASNYKLADDYLIQPAHIPHRHVHRICGEMRQDGGRAIRLKRSREFFGLEEGEMPRFDVVHRGMGPGRAHRQPVPGDPLIDDREGIAAAVFAPKFNQCA